MHLSVSLPAFVVAVLLISASPGPAMALILRRTALHGMRTAVPLVIGLELGLYLWALAAAAGFAALVAASEAAYWALKVVGACVLVYLGLRAWLAAWRSRGGEAIVRKGSDPVIVTGKPSELVLFFFGRSQLHEVTFDGAPSAITRLQEADKGF